MNTVWTASVPLNAATKNTYGITYSPHETCSIPSFLKVPKIFSSNFGSKFALFTHRRCERASLSVYNNSLHKFYIGGHDSLYRHRVQRLEVKFFIDFLHPWNLEPTRHRE
jgi:hypothetical protein